ncbi:sensor histidine kinase [Saccharothrix xinjiangensis]|uniref:histidine kinase n=1 Tax=Saccharothrix xinjiangensis TaxID=204798 RepID=A0ABV9Y3K3_9PSEU
MALGPGARWAVDAVAAGVVVLWAGLRSPEPDALAWVAAAALGGPLAARGRWPVAVLVAVALVGVVAVVTGLGQETVPLALAWALYPLGLASARSGAVGAAGALASVAAAGVAVAVVPGLPLVPAPEGAESFATTPVAALLYSAVVIAGSWAVAAVVRDRRRRTAELAAARTARALAEERLRIARDIHDVVGHNLSLIAMKAAVANHLAEGRPGEREAALRMIEQVSRSALADVRTVVGALRDLPARHRPGGRDEVGPGPDRPAEPDRGANHPAEPHHGPDQPPEPHHEPDHPAGLDHEPDHPAEPGYRLDPLVDEARSAGVVVTARHADLSGLPAAVRVSAYRIAQEALTNVRRHSRPPRCRLVTAVEPDRLVISVVDEGTARPGPPGHGLLGMRERVDLHGGTLHAGSAPGGGFEVRATLPFGGAP